MWGVLRSPPWRHVPCGRSGAEGQQAARPREPTSPGMRPVHVFRDQRAGRGPEARPAVRGQRHGPRPWGLAPVAERAAHRVQTARRAQQVEGPGPGRGRGGGAAGSRAHRSSGGWSSWVRTDEEAGRVPPGLGGAERELVDPLGTVASHAGQALPWQGLLPGASWASARPPAIPLRPHLNVRGAPSVSTALRVAPHQSAPCPLADRS